MKINEKRKGKQKMFFLFCLLFSFIFFSVPVFAWSWATTTVPTGDYVCALLAKNSAGTYDILMTAYGSNTAPCSLSCIGADGKLRAECNKPTLPGWPKPTMAVKYYESKLGAPNGYNWNFGAANCGSKAGSCGPQDKVGLYFKDFTADFSAYVTDCSCTLHGTLSAAKNYDVLLDSSGGVIDSSGGCRCTVSCVNSDGSLKSAACNNQNLYGWPKPYVKITYSYAGAQDSGFGESACVQASCSSTGNIKTLTYHMQTADLTVKSTTATTTATTTAAAATASVTYSCSPSSKLGDITGDSQILSNDVLIVTRIAAGTLAKPSNICCIDLYPKGAPDGIINSNDYDTVSRISIGTEPDYVGKTCTNPVQQPGCAYNNPACGADYDCVNNACIRKAGVTTMYSMLWEIKGSARDLFFHTDSLGKSQIYLNSWDGYANPFVGCSVPSKKVWHNYVTVLDKKTSTAKLYIDGIYCGKAVYKDPKAEGDFYLSFPGTASENTAWNGGVDDAVVVNRALSEDEIKSLYNSGLSASCDVKNPGSSGYYCSRSGDWSRSRNQVASEVSGEISARKKAPSDYKPAEAGFSEFNCCPANSCWDGFTCAPPNLKQFGKVLANGQFIPESLVAGDLTGTIKAAANEYACMQRINSRDNLPVGEADWINLDTLNVAKSESICKTKYPAGNPEDKGWTGTTCCFKTGQYYSESVVCRIEKILGKSQEVCYADSGMTTKIDLSKIVGGCWNGKIIPTQTRLSSDPRYFVDRMGKFSLCNGTSAKFPDGTAMNLASACTTSNSSEENTDMFFCEPKATNKQSGEWKEKLSHVDGNIAVNKLSPKTSGLPDGVTAADVKTSYPEQCCPAAYCWNGNKCITSGSDGEQNILTVKGKNFRCLNEKWREVSFKYDWDNEKKGACASESSCYVKQISGNVGSDAYAAPYLYTSSSPPKCLAGELPNRLDFTYIGDHLCEKGNWTTRTKFVALKLINYTQKQKSDNFVLSCGDYSDVLNVYDFPAAYTVYDKTGKPVSKTDSAEKIFGAPEDLKPNKRKYSSHEISECFGQECANNVCVLKLREGAAEKVIMGVSLNQEIYDYTGQNNNFLSAFKKDTGLSLSGCDAPVTEMKRLIALNGNAGNTGKYMSCGTQKLWYNPQMRIMLYSKDAFSLEAPGLIDFMASPLNALKNIFSKAFTSGKAASAGANEIVSAQNFDTLYYAKSGGREVKGVIEKKLVGPDYDKKSYVTMSLEYTGFTDNICSEIQKQTSQDLEFVELPIKCAKGSEKDGGKTSVSVVVPYSEFSEQAVNNLWKELIKIKLDLCSVAVPDGMNECADTKYCLDRGIRLMADNDPGTFWYPAAASANAKIVFKSTVKGNTKISYAWRGDNNNANCNGEISVSADDINYASIFKGKNAGAPASLTTDKSFSYMKIKVGNSAGQDCGWVRINEISVSGGTEGLCWQ